MDSRTRLDYVLFQLTPTRTRCDLVIFAGNKTEKLATGLLEPFLSHLKYAKDHISKGGYSITLRPSSTNASWFTKSTLERFVRFVSTPEVLERFVTIEREIEQIENSIQLNEQTNGAIEAEGGNLKSLAASTKIESNGNGDARPEEHSKVRLLRVLETRKVVLRKEQAMAYARALVVGFETDFLDDLISFSDVFGALRLREACINFRELCNKKSNDGIWMDEVAAMQACSHSEFPFLGTSGIIIAGEGNDGGLSNSRQQNGQVDASASDSAASLGSLDTNLENSLLKTATEQSTERNVQVPPWAPYMHNFQGPPFQQMPPYQGYIFPGMQLPQPYYPANVPWPSSVEDSSLGLHPDDNWKKSSKKKEKASNGIQRTGKENDSDEPSLASSASDSDDFEDCGRRDSLDQLHKKKPGKRSSRKVVIRNINYISSKRNGERGSTSEDESSDGGEFINADSLKQQVDEALGSLERHHKSTSGKNKKRDLRKKQNNDSDGVADQDPKRIVSISPEGKKRSQNWDAFQNLLMKDADSKETNMGASTEQYEEYTTSKNPGKEKGTSFNVESEMPKHRGSSTNSFLLGERAVDNDGKLEPTSFEAGENDLAVFKRGSADEELLFSQRVEGSEIYSQALLATCGIEPSVVKSQREEDWLIGNQPNKSPNQGKRVDHAIFDGNDASVFTGEPLPIIENRRDLVDDFFMIQGGPISETTHSEPKTDIFLESDIAGTKYGKPDYLQDKVEVGNVYEPDDLYMVLGRDSAAEQAAISWNPEMDYLNENSVGEAVKRQSDVELSNSVDVKKLRNAKSTNTSTSKSPGGKVLNKQARETAGSLGRSKSEIIPRNKKTPGSKLMVQSKAGKEDENRKKKEEQLIQRQKRIAERSAGGGSAVTSRTTPKENKKATAASAKNGKTTVLAPTEEIKNLQKPAFRSSTIDRLSAPRKTDMRSSTESKLGPKKTTTKDNGVKATSALQTNGPDNKKMNQNKIKVSDEKIGVKDSSAYSAVSEASERDGMKVVPTNPNEHSSKETTLPAFDDYSEDTKELHSVSRDMILKRDAHNESSLILPKRDSPVPAEDHSAETDCLEVNVEVISKASLVKGMTGAENCPGPISQMTGHPLPSNVLNMDENGTATEKVFVSHEVSMMEMSTPPPNNETSPEANHLRKKWNNAESSPKVTKGFRKLLLFGRKSSSSLVN